MNSIINGDNSFRKKAILREIENNRSLHGILGLIHRICDALVVIINELKLVDEKNSRLMYLREKMSLPCEIIYYKHRENEKRSLL